MKKSTGKIEINETAEVIMPKITGEIIKIVIHNNKKNSSELRIKITTADGEEIANREIGSKNCILYPKNRAAINEFIDLDIQQSVIIGESSGERFFNDGLLKIELENGNKKDYLEDVVVMVK